MRSRSFEIIKFLIGWPISLVSIFFLLNIIVPNSPMFFSKIRGINLPVILLSVFSFQFYFFLRGILWQKILKHKGYNLPIKKVLFLWSFSELKRYAPGNIWSFLGRLVYFNRLGIKKKDIFHSLFIESLIIVVSSALVSLLSLRFIFYIFHGSEKDIFIQPFIFLIVIFLFILFIFNKKIFKRFIVSNFNPLSNFYLVSISFLSLFFFGLGTYFAASSIFFLDPKYFLGYIGFFVLALLVGYISIITPMGLGVREGVISVVLSRIFSVSEAAFISIFARIIFIISEIIFIFISWVFYQTKNKIVLKITDFASNNKQECLLSVFILSYFLYFVTASFLRYDAFFTGRFDLGNMDQTVWNTIHGRIFQLTNPNGTDNISRLSFHADFVLILISPLYWLWSNPKMLLLIQAIVLPLGGLFVYFISQKILKDKNISLILSLAFLLNPAVNHSNLYDFHPVVLATTFLLAAFYFMVKKNYFLLAIFLILAGLCKENIWVINSLFGFYLFLFSKKRAFGVLISALSLSIFIFLVWYTIPKLAGSQHFALSYYSDFGDSPTKIIKNIITSPIKTFSTIFQKDQLTYLQQLFQPLGFLPVFAPIYLFFAAPSLLIDILSSNSQLHKIYFQYSSSITPFLFISTIYSIKFLKKLTPRIPITFYAIFVLLSTLLAAYDYGPLIGSRNSNIEMFTENLSNEILIDRFLERVPKRYSVAGTNNVGSHLSHRQRIFTLPVGIDEADLIIIYYPKTTADPNNLSEKKLVDRIIKENKYFTVYRDYEFIVFKKKGLRKSFYYF